MSVLTIAVTKHRTKRLNNPDYVKNRIFKKLKDSYYFLLAKWLFHSISIFSTTMMLSSSLVDWVKVPLANIGIDLMQYGNDLFLPTVITSATMSLILEVTSTKTMSSTIEALRVNSGLFDVTLRVTAMSILVATQLYTFVGGAKNTLIYALVPTTYQDEIRSDKKRVAYYENLEDIISKKITSVKDGTGEIDDIYGSGTSQFLKRFENDLEKAKTAHEAFMEREKKKSVNLDKKGNFTRVAKALIDKRYMDLVKPIEDSYNKAKNSKLDKKKMWLMSAKNDLIEQRRYKQEYLDKATKVTEEFKKKIEEVSNKIQEKYYWYGAIFLLLALSAMDFMHGRTLDEALKSFDNAKSSTKNKDFNPEVYQAEEKKPSLRKDKDLFSTDSDTIDDMFLQYLADTYLETGKIPSTTSISESLEISVGTISNIFKRNSHYFIRENGKATLPTEKFLDDYNLGLALVA